MLPFSRALQHTLASVFFSVIFKGVVEFADADSLKGMLVWQDDFEGDGALDSSQWNHQDWQPGVVNNELQAYTSRLENSRKENGTLIIECRRDGYQGNEYTSARLFTTMGWTYGRFEARIRFPSGLGTWPAFWLFPQNPYQYATTCNDETGWTDGCDAWPNSGEIDVVEFVGYQPEVIHGSAHTKLNNFKIGTQYTGTLDVPTATEDFHVYAVEWRANQIDYFVDGEMFFTISRDGKSWENYPFDHDFHIILNLAYGGDWGSYAGIDTTIFDRDEGVRFEIDYVRVYTLPDANVTAPIDYVQAPAKIEAENYFNQNGIQTELTSDIGGGRNIGYMDVDDWVEYNIAVPRTNNFLFRSRVAGIGKGALVLTWKDNEVGRVIIPPTGDWQVWTTVESVISLSEGSGILRLRVLSPGFNLNFFEILLASEVDSTNAPVALPTKIPSVAPTADGSQEFRYMKVEAEDYIDMRGIQVEPCFDNGGGQNVGWISDGDWMVYPVSLATDGVYTVSYRLASLYAGGRFRLDANAGSELIDVVSVPSTGDWQKWTTVTHTASLKKGSHNFGIYAYSGGFNINFFELTLL